MNKLDGIWDLTVGSIVGDQFSVLEVKVDGAALSGLTTDNNTGNSCPLSNGKIDGSKFSYEASVKLPMGTIAFTMEGELNESGTEISGTSTTVMGVSNFTGKKRV